MASSSSSSSSSLPRWKYDVFLSFRGIDTRKNFTDHLYTALCQKQIYTFRDDEKLERGKSISPELLKAIEESRYAITVLSKNYASSTWCLEELAKIVECMKQMGMIVYPIFYYVNPSDVLYQRGSFAEAFVKHEEVFKENRQKTQRWRDALKEVANLSGWHLYDSYESTIVNEIVRKIHSQLNSLCSSVSKNLVGIGHRVEKVMNLCKSMSVDHVCFMGIYGMSGIGKTTLARAIYKRISCQFEGSVFLANVREETEKGGLVSLQRQLLSTILVEREIVIRDVEEGATMIQKRLHSKRVLIILDDVDKHKQLHALAQTHDWFGGGSKIIITTRNKRLLIEHDVAEDVMYEAKELNHSEAFQLFSLKALKEDYPPKTFVELAKEFINYARGHPLALEVLGSSLYRRSVDLWKSMLINVKKAVGGEIQDMLHVSFDKLSKIEKIVFLDIACFFKGEDKNRARDILESCGCDPSIIIDDLINKSLITVQLNRLWLHDLLEDMGQKIVYSESSTEPGLRSRLWLSEDIHHVLKNNKGTERVEGIILKSTLQEELHLNPKAFSKLKNLRMLKICNVYLSKGLTHLPNKLWIMEWFGYPLKSLPKSFTPFNLVELIMPHSCIRSIWKGKKNLCKLKVLDLGDSQNLLKTPDFTGLPNLEKLIFQGCVKLSKVHPSIGNLKRLILLNLRDCISLNSLPRNISLDSLETLILSGCSKIKKFPEIVGDMKNFSELHLDSTAIKDLPLSMEHLTGLTFLNLENCKGLLALPSFISTLTSLKTINLSGLSKDQKNVEYLEELDIRGTARQACTDGFEWQQLTSRFFNFWSLSSPNIGFLLPTLFSSLSSLTKLNLSYCNLSNGATLSDLSKLSSLQLLDLSGNKFKYISESISQLSKLKRVNLQYCSRLRSLPKFSSSVQYVRRHYCTSMESNFNEIDIVTSDEIGTYVLRAFTAGNLDVRSSLQACIDLGRIACCTLPPDGFPMLFNNLNYGSYLKLRVDRDFVDRGNWLGYALYFEAHGCRCGSLAHKRSPANPSGHLYHYVFLFVTDEGFLKQPLVLVNRKVVSGLFRFCLYIPRFWFAERSYNMDAWSSIEATIRSTCPTMEVHMCGARLIYKRNAHDFVQICMVHPFDFWAWT